VRHRRALAAAAVAYLATALAGTWLALRDDLVATPLGLRTGLTVRTDLSVGVGTALSAPPPMLLALAWSVPGVRRGDRRTVAVLGVLSAGFLAGMASEPVVSEVMGSLGEHPGRTVVVVANLALPTVMVVLAFRDLVRRGSD
jgi:hypothetical protein